MDRLWIIFSGPVKTVYNQKIGATHKSRSKSIHKKWLDKAKIPGNMRLTKLDYGIVKRIQH